MLPPCSLPANAGATAGSGVASSPRAHLPRRFESLQLVLASDEMQVTSRDVAARMADLPELGDVPLT